MISTSCARAGGTQRRGNNRHARVVLVVVVVMDDGDQPQAARARSAWEPLSVEAHGTDDWQVQLFEWLRGLAVRGRAHPGDSGGSDGRGLSVGGLSA